MGAPGSIGTPGKILVLFDGVCNLCSGAVQFIIKRDPASKFIFASLQSDFGIAQLKKYGLHPGSLHSIIVIEQEELYQRSDAALRIVHHLNGIWPMLGIFKFLPRLIRDALYNLVALNRYKIFGRTDSCMIPAEGIRARFIE